MSKCICVMGESGSGKTTAMRNLDPKSTFVIDCDKKGLSWKGWKAQYNTDNKNYFCNNEPEKVILMLKRIAKDFSHIKVAVIDTINGIMIGDEMRRSKEKGYDKWADLAGCIWDLLDIALTLRDDLTVIFTAHTQTERDDSGFYFTRIKTSGRKLDKIVLESKFTTVLLSKCVNDQYVFETSSNNSTAKTPMGAFAEKEIPNDIVEVLKALEEF